MVKYKKYKTKKRHNVSRRKAYKKRFKQRKSAYNYKSRIMPTLLPARLFTKLKYHEVVTL